ncbi:MAG: S8 family serine peptidase [Brumimicrobium sp.]|nr:S8 family serine peptidase [Brumimicrobium sp.]
MVFQKFILSFFLIFLTYHLQAQKFGFTKVLRENPEVLAPFAVDNTPDNLAYLKTQHIAIKNISKEWIYITCTPAWIQEQLQQKSISNFYFEYAPPVLLDDTARLMQQVDPVHQGDLPLHDKFTGKGVLIGFVDSGLDYRHPDFIDTYGNTRVLRYWDQSNKTPSVMPQPYNYGQIWYEDDIQNQVFIGSNGDLGHGTTVTGIAAGNGFANGRNKGMAPDAKIVFVQTDFTLPNWTLTVADACDFIFRIADSLHLPAVINLSVGSYLGSHDGKDPGSQLMEQLVENKSGRIIIGAAGNGGKYEPYHAQNILDGTDTTFLWFENNPTNQIEPNSIYFDLWSDITSAQYKYSFGANNPAKGYSNVGETVFRAAQINVGVPIYDTIRNMHGDRIATLEIYTEYVGSNYHMEAFFSKVDSTDYLFRFSTTGIGQYDLWTGEWMDLNKIVRVTPSPAIYPSIVNYVYPDSAQSIVSSWNCSPKMVSVANVRGRTSYIDYNGNPYYPAESTLSGRMARSTSKGPTRHNVIKPDISATGDMTLGSAPLYMINDQATYATTLDQGGYHARNGGTSMASPVVAGIAALYLERCPNSTYEDFINDIHATGFGDIFTGTIPNNKSGYGKINALTLLNSKNNHLEILGDSIVCQVPIELKSNIPLLSYTWSNGSSNSKIYVSQADTLYLIGRDLQGCKIYSDTFIVKQGSPLTTPTISILGDSLVSSVGPNYQWYLNDTPIPGAIQQSYKPTTPGFYSVAIQEEGSCKSFSNAIDWALGLEQESSDVIKLYPNPAQDILNIKSDYSLIEGEIFTVEGKRVMNIPLENTNQVSIESLSIGAYLFKVTTTQGVKVLPFFKD